MKNNFLLKPLAITAVGLLLLSAAQAQTPGSGGPTPQTPTAVPIDGGATLLLASGVALGLKKLRDRRRAR
ncbi:hypothetical protein GKZ68_16095 [Hymenobacter sp. BRD128]|uniref:PID-CTERM protein-sorting domain-containing protein n=1 Tax=Hymenobacter sp. BRD128 TaxID=2675878 RepID=UPI00156391DE|nr:hypothetical protein [Hymenobacter sp. BRD128]QKG58005.1 hypothetical protein GKZ68_16095 [Hymenobacter sp. BRD128]